MPGEIKSALIGNIDIPQSCECIKGTFSEHYKFNIQGKSR